VYDRNSTLTEERLLDTPNSQLIYAMGDGVLSQLLDQKILTLNNAHF
jgi:hypothetical protein